MDREVAIQVDIKEVVSLAAGEGEEDEDEGFAGNLGPGVPQLYQLQVVPQKSGKQGRPQRQPEACLVCSPPPRCSKRLPSLTLGTSCQASTPIPA